jgi:RHS repeat-associated protein
LGLIQKGITGKDTSYTYDALNRMTAVEDGTNEFKALYEYTKSGRIQSVTTPVLKTRYGYDGDGNLTLLQIHDEKQGRLLADNTYHFDRNGNQISKKTLSGETTYAYDVLGQLIAEHSPYSSTTYGYDKAGNRTFLENEYRREDYSYQNNSLTDRTVTKKGLAFADFGGAAPEEAAKSYLGGAVGEGSSTQNVISYHYIYDAQGNTLSDGENNYTYDALNRIAQVTTKAGDIQRNHYDAEGLRHQMEENGELVSFLYSDREAILEEDTAGNRVRYIRGHELLASDCAAARTYYHYASDEMGSITHIVDEEGEIRNCYEYDAFGNFVVQEETVKNRFGFTGEIRDALTGQYYLRARFYNPVVARFLNEDIYYGDGLNLYAYCHNNPVGYIDPSGHICEDKYAAIESIRKEHGLTAEQALNKYKELRNSGMSAQEIRNTIENSGRNGNGAGEGGRYTEIYYTGETKVGGETRDISRKVYQRNDIDWDRIDPATGLSNREIALKGGAPYWSDGTKIELHHLLQKEPGPMVEIPASMHDKYYKTLHGLVGDGESFRNNPVLEKQYNNFRSKYWRWRAKNL